MTRVNADIDTWGLFSPHFLSRNLDAALVMLPDFKAGLGYSPWGLSLLLTLLDLAAKALPTARAA